MSLQLLVDDPDALPGKSDSDRKAIVASFEVPRSSAEQLSSATNSRSGTEPSHTRMA